MHSIRILLLLLAFAAMKAQADDDYKMLYEYHDGQTTSNWSPAAPQIILTHGAVSDMKQADKILSHMKSLEKIMVKNHPGVKVVIVRGADGPSMVKHLANPNTVGLVLIAHGYKTKTGTPLLGMDGYPLPSAILSAATPSLRFVGFFACEGGDDNIARQYQVEYELNRLPGQQMFVHSKDKRLTLGGGFARLISGSLSKRLRQFADVVSEMDLTNGVSPVVEKPATLKLVTKDVIAKLEPRFVYVNGKIVGVLDNSAEFRAQNFMLQTYEPKAKCQRVAIMSAELSSGGSIVDDYMISEVGLDAEKSVEKIYASPLHIGDDATPVTEVAPEPGKQPRKEAGKKAMDAWLAKVAKWVKYQEWIDRNPTNWTPVKGRIYSDCL